MEKMLLLLLACCSLLITSKAQSLPRDTTYNIPHVWRGAKKNYPNVRIPTPDLPRNVTQQLDVVYLTIPNTAYGDRALHADIFRPKGNDIFPAVVMVHGGGWRSGTKDMQWALAKQLAAHGFVTVCVEHQLSLEASYPAALYNLKAAIRWLRANADTYGVDTNHIAISGCSAGGHLAALTGLTTGVKEKEGNLGYADYSSDIQAIIDIDGVVDFMAPLSLNLERKPTSADIAWLGGSFYEKPAIWKDASPIFWAHEKSPPMLFIKSGFPRFTAGQHELCGMMEIWGIYTEVHQFDVQVHPFWLLDPWVTPTVEYMAAFLQKVWGD